MKYFIVKIALLGMVLGSLATAAPIVFTNEAAFLAAVTNAGTDTFDDLGISFYAGPLNRTAGSYSYTLSAGAGLYPAGVGGDHWAATDMCWDTMTVSGLSAGVNAVGGYFFGSDQSGAFKPGQSIVVTAIDGSGSVSETLLNTTTGSFLGVVTASAFTSISVRAVQPEVGPFPWATINNLVLAQAAPSEVPEPGTWGLMATGLALAVWRARRK